MQPPEFLTTNWLLAQFGRTSAEAVRTYRALVKRGRDVEVWDAAKAGMLMGSDSVVQSLRPLLRDVEENREFCREEKLATRPTLEELFVNATDKATRNESIHSAARTHQHKLREVGDHIGLCCSTINVIAKRVDESNRS